MTTLQRTLIALVLAAVGLGIYQTRRASNALAEADRLRSQRANMTEQIAQLTGERDDAARQLETLRGETARSGGNQSELLRLRGEVTVLRREQEDLVKQLATKLVQRTSAPSGTDEAWVEQVLNGPVRDQGMAAGVLRGKMLRREIADISSAEIALQQALRQRQLNHSLERSPAEFADFQTAFVSSVISLKDEDRTRQMRDLIQGTYEKAVADGLDVASKPASDTDDWVQRRFALDRAATAQLQQMLTPEERAAFDRAFLGVMGVDLGGGVDRSNYPKGFFGPE